MSSTSATKHIHLDLVGGIAGDMFVSALLDMQPDIQSLVEDAVSKILPSSAGKPVVERGLNSGISGLRFSLVQAHKEDASTQHTHSHTHHQHAHTTYRYLCQLIERSALQHNVIERAIHLLTIIAKAEAKIHATTLDEVHFHELADWDSLMDVVACAVIIEALPNHTWSISDLPLGGGLVNTQHGLIPVPAPATSEILRGFTFNDDGVKGERITPTGAAILKCLSESECLVTPKGGELMTSGYGLGTKILKGMPNILRASVYQCTDNSAQQSAVVSIEFDIDDMTGEELGLASDLIRQYAGVIDLVVLSGRGKKNRGVECVKVLAETEHYQQVIDYIFVQTTTIGLRYRFDSRVCLTREHIQIDNKSYKRVVRPNHISTCKAEHDQLANIPSLQERRDYATQNNSLKK